MRWGDKELLCFQGERWQVCRSWHKDYPTLDRAIAAHSRVNRGTLLIDCDATIPTLTLLNGHAPTLDELSRDYFDDYTPF